MQSQNQIEHLAQGVGYAATTACAGLTCWVNWLDHHADAVIALSAIASALVAIAGFAVSWHYKRVASQKK
jgi:hypothetical protein